MRTTFFKTLTQLAKRDPRIMFMTGDLGFMAVEPYREAVPNQFLNAGTAEANMIGMAAGMAMTGRKVFVYSIIPFITLRVYEFIRNDICYHRLPVTVVGVGAGFAYSNQGATHHATEDISIMRALPHMAVIAPADPWEVEQAVQALTSWNGPAYLRLGKTGEPKLHQQPASFQIGRSITLREGGDVTIFSAGSILANVLKAADCLEEMGIHARVISMHTVKPLDAEAVVAAAEQTRAIVTVEENNIIGGLGSAVAETLADMGAHALLRRLGVNDNFVEVAGSYPYILSLHNLAPQSIAKAAKDALEHCRPPC